jgi:hypothetical protein
MLDGDKVGNTLGVAVGDTDGTNDGVELGS